MKIILKYLANKVAGKKAFQSLFKTLHKISLIGMGYGGGSHVDNSGEKYVLNKLKSDLDNIVVFDVGANIGNYTQLCIDTFGSKLDYKIYAFEPSKKTYDALSLNIKANNNISLINAGLGEIDSESILYSTKELDGIASVYKRQLSHFNSQMDKEEEIQITSVDNFCNKNNIKSIDLLKLDIEGHELTALHGAKSMLSRRAIKNIQFEFGGCNIDSKTFLQDFYYLLHEDFMLFRIVNDGVIPVLKYSEMDEIFITTNYFASLRNN